MNETNDKAALKQRLTKEQYEVTQESGTERAFSGKYYAHKSAGQYLCVCCGQALFGSQEKYDSGSGWPSFWAPMEPGVVSTQSDTSHGMSRDEVNCSHCGAHLGHVFDDGPQPTGQRFCINSAALDFESDNN